ncbi:MAG: alpha-L-arabinofuranosidase [Tannerellaceae bacterium]|jgi:alpha-N-arabinofuranosidase|nr:alpha-L-arabinofuranosidase [Tannerellaceae bacterium]
MKPVSLLLLAVLINVAQAQEVSINILSNKTDGLIDPKIYGQLFEHIYFSANNGLWQEMIYERSFEPEHYPGIPPRDGFFDGWFVDDDQVLHSPTRYEQPIPLATIEEDSYEISMDINWRAYKLVGRRWSGGLLDIRFAFGNGADGEPYFFRIHDPYYNARTARSSEVTEPNFSISVMAETEVTMPSGMPGWNGGTRKIRSLQALKAVNALSGQIDEGGTWHKLRINCQGKNAKIYWDNKQILSYNNLKGTKVNDIAFWVNYTEALYRNIKITSANGRTIYFEGMPDAVQTPAVAPQWKSFGGGAFELVKGDAVNMNYSQRITAGSSKSGLYQGPQNIIKGETYIGSVYAKGDEQAELSIAIKAGEGYVAENILGKPGRDWKKYEFTLHPTAYQGDADFAICVRNGSVQVDQISITSQTAKNLGGFRPDIYQAVKNLRPSSMRWPGGGYVAQYNWKWGIGTQEDRQRWPYWMWLDYDQNAFGTDEFVQLCRQINSEPVMVVRVGYDRPPSEHAQILQEACDWLAYCNEPATGEWGAKRAANGHPEPYNIRYWEIDNEMWEMGIEKYELALRTFSTAMRKIDPHIKIIACGGFPDDEGLLNRSGSYFDYLSLHHYEGANGYATGPARLGQQYNKYATMIAACPNPNIKLYISEWNLNSIDWRTGLFAGGFLNMCERTPVVEMGAAALFIRRTDAPDWNNAFINFDYKDVFVAPNYLITKLWYDNFSKYRLAYTGETGDLNISTTLSENGSKVIVKIVNPMQTSRNLTIKGDWKGILSAGYTYYASSSLNTANSMENKNTLSLHTKDIHPEKNTINLSIDPLSAGIILIEKEF